MQIGVSRAEARELRRYRRFYLTYPQIRESLSPELRRTLLPQPDASNNRESLTPKLGRRRAYCTALFITTLLVLGAVPSEMPTVLLNAVFPTTVN